MGKVSEVIVKQTEKRTESLLIATMRRGRDQDQVARRICSDPTQQLKALLASLAHTPSQSATVGFIHDYEFRTSTSKVLCVACRFDEIGRDHGKTVTIKYRDAQRQVSLKPLDSAGQHELSIDMKFLGELLLPLFGKVRRA